MKTILFAFIFVLATFSHGFSFSTDTTSTLDHKRIGLTLNAHSGGGISYLVPISENSSIQYNGIFLYVFDEFGSSSLASLGLEYQYDLVKSEKGRVYAGGGAGMFREKNKSEDRIEDRLASSVRFGVMVGFETARSNLFTSSVSISYYTIARDGDLSFLGIGAGLNLSVPLGRKKKK